MTQAEISGISPFFYVSHVPSALSFYRDRLGFEITFQGPAPDDIFFGIVRRGGAQILLKNVGVTPLPNYKRDVKKGIARWTRMLTCRILTRWRPNLLRAMWSFPSH
jgi:catechol 2,3-dioxygenase-like lactoylglutathione lyase family enzyme